jgi:SAM-dependent methyltransferase
MEKSDRRNLCLELTRRIRQIAMLVEVLGDDSKFDSWLNNLSVDCECLARKLENLHRTQVTSEIQTVLASAAVEKPYKLNLGSGSTHLKGWVNIDVTEAADLRMFVPNALPFSAESVKLVFMSHVLEHLYYPEETSNLLRDLYSLLAPGGKIRIVVPDLEKCLNAYVCEDIEFFRKRSESFEFDFLSQSLLDQFLHYAGAGVRPDHLWGHKYGYDFDTIERLLIVSGFDAVKRCSFMSSEDLELRIDSTSKVASCGYKEDSYSMFVEASKLAS